MNFLEQLVSEWYEYRGYFVRTNIKFGKRDNGGYLGEMDVIAYHPKHKTLTHIETSMDADSWEKRKKKFVKKFRDANSFYKEMFDFPINDDIQQIVIVNYGKPKTEVKFGDNIEFCSIPMLMKKITSYVSKLNPLKNAIQEEYPLLRAIQFAAYWGGKE